MTLYHTLDEYSCQCMDLPLFGVKEAIGPDNLALPLVPEKREYIPQRLVKLQLCQNAIESILAIGSNGSHRELHQLTHSIR